MKRYFSELARHTGIRIGSSGRTAAAASPPSAQPNSEVRGLAVEEVTFTSMSEPTTVKTYDVGATATPATEVAEISDIRSEGGAPRIHKPLDPAIEVTAFSLTDVEASARRNLPSTEIETRRFDPHPRVVISAPGLVDEQTSASGQVAESLSAPKFRNATSATEFDFGDPQPEIAPDEVHPGPYSRSTDQSKTGLDERVERQLVVRNYLREISEWISTPVAEEESASLIADDTGASTIDLRANRTNVSAADRSRTAVPEQQDLTLSIGTIKIVVEEPRAQAAAPPTPPASTERTFERPTTAPTDLSRYYINRW